MPKITTFLTYDHQAEEAAKLYVSVFKNSRIRNVTRHGQDACSGRSAARPAAEPER